jgi:hypothetical protein
VLASADLVVHLWDPSVIHSLPCSTGQLCHHKSSMPPRGCVPHLVL